MFKITKITYILICIGLLSITVLATYTQTNFLNEIQNYELEFLEPGEQTITLDAPKNIKLESAKMDISGSGLISLKQSNGPVFEVNAGGIGAISDFIASDFIANDGYILTGAAIRIICKDRKCITPVIEKIIIYKGNSESPYDKILGSCVGKELWPIDHIYHSYYATWGCTEELNIQLEKEEIYKLAYELNPVFLYSNFYVETDNNPATRLYTYNEADGKWETMPIYSEPNTPYRYDYNLVYAIYGKSYPSGLEVDIGSDSSVEWKQQQKLTEQNSPQEIIFTNALNDLLEDCSANECNIPVKVSTETAGKILLNNLKIDYTTGEPPVISSMPKIIMKEDQSQNNLDLDDYVDDPDNLDEELTWAFSGYQNIDVLISQTTHKVEFQPNPNWFGTEIITFTVTDPDGLQDSADMTIEVTPEDDPAVWQALENQNINEDSPDNTVIYLNIESKCTDIDNPKNIIIGSAHEHFNLAILGSDLIILGLEQNWMGSETIQLKCNEIPASFVLNVNPINDAPVISDIPDQTINENQEFEPINLNNYANDVDNANEKLSWTSSGFVNLIIEIVNNMATIIFPENWFGIELITFTVQDLEGLQDSDQATFTVNKIPSVNNPPIINEAEFSDIYLLLKNTPIQIDLSNKATDTDNDELIWSSYSVDSNGSQIQGYLSITIDENNIATIAPEADWSGNEFIKFTVSDGELQDSITRLFIVSSEEAIPITIVSPEPRTYYTNSIPLEIIVDRPNVTINFWLNSEITDPGTEYTTTVILTPEQGIQEGENTIIVTAVDENNVGGFSVVTFTVDTSLPIIKENLPTQNKIYISNELTLDITVDKQISWCKVSIDSQASEEMALSNGHYTKTKTLNSGEHTAKFQCQNLAQTLIEKIISFKIADKFNIQNETSPLYPYNGKSFVSLDIDKDQKLEYAIDNNTNSTDGFELYLDIEANSSALLAQDIDNDQQIDFIVQASLHYWNPDNQILYELMLLENSIYVFDSDGDGAPDKKYNVQTNSVEDYNMPFIKIVSPESKTYTTSSVDLLYTILGKSINWCGYSLNSQATVTLENCKNTTLSSLSNGNYLLTIYANNTQGNLSSKTINFKVEVPSPEQEEVTDYYYAGDGGIFGVDFKDLPSEVDIKKGETKTIIIRFENIGTIKLRQCKLEIILPEIWKYSIEPTEIDPISMNEVAEFNLTVTAPEETNEISITMGIKLDSRSLDKEGEIKFNILSPVIAQCSDGIDNDNDGLTDLADPNCENSEDNTEASETPPLIPGGLTGLLTLLANPITIGLLIVILIIVLTIGQSAFKENKKQKKIQEAEKDANKQEKEEKAEEKEIEKEKFNEEDQ